MGEADELYTQVGVLNREAGELEAEAVVQEDIGLVWNTGARELFNKLSDTQTEADWHFQLSDTARLAAKKKRKEARKLERKARRIIRRGR